MDMDKRIEAGFVVPYICRELGSNRWGTYGCQSNIGPTLQRCKTLGRNGCVLKTMTAQMWPWLGSHLSIKCPWLHSVSTPTPLTMDWTTEPCQHKHADKRFHC